MGVGLDIGSRTIKIVELGMKDKKWDLKSSGIVGHKGGTPAHTTDKKEIGLIAESIKKLHKEAKVSKKEITISLPESQVYSRVVKFPLLTDSEINSAVRWEAEQYIPIPVDEAIIQHQIIERRKNMATPQAMVLLVAAPKELVKKYANVIDKAGLRLAAVETELISLVRCLGSENRTEMIVDFGAGSTDIAISKNAQLAFSRSIPTAGEAFTRAVAQGLGVDPRQAEEYKRKYGLQTQQLEGKVSEVLNPVFRMVADEMKKSIHFYQTEEKGEAPGSVILSGGTAGMPEAASTLTKMLGVEVVVGNPFSKVNVPPEAVQTLSGYAPLYAVSVGLAMRER